jgi:hypothetical protein
MHTPLRTATPLTLALALAAALACDEKAPTETRAPSEVSASAGEVDGLAQQDASTMAIPLPVNQNVATNGTIPGFRINQTGSGPNGIFQITRTTSTQTALQGLTNGRGRAGFFQITNAANTGPALQAQTNGSGFAVQGLAGSGGAGSFQITNPANTKDALVAQTSGRGRAGLFSNTNLGNSVPVLEATRSAGSGHAVRGTILAGSGGRAGEFDIFNRGNPDVALVGWTIGLGTAGHFEIANETNSSPALKAITVGSGPAGLFEGNVTVHGTLTKTAGSFKIDHPLDPEHKYLSHSFIESPDMMNVYSGNVALDAEGRATVQLPDYFEALNRDFRYQLTAIGAPGPNLYIAEGVKENRFRIAGGRAYARVSWMVTGVRQDTYANEHRIKVEEEKPQTGRGLIAHR